jgi:hypothetical protein
VSPLRAPDDDRNWMPVSRRRGSKSLNENLAPLRRYLRGNVGRPWDKVFSEICHGLSVRSAVQKHVRDHLRDFVELHAEERGGQLWGGRYTRHLLGQGWRDQLYVCPRTGLLKLLAARPRVWHRTRQSPVTWLGPALAVLRIRDRWMLVEVVSTAGLFGVFDAVCDQWVRCDPSRGSARLTELYERPLVAGARLRQLTAREVRRLPLRGT